MIPINLPEDVAGAQALAASPVNPNPQAPLAINPSATAALGTEDDGGAATLNLPLAPQAGVSASMGDQLKALGYRPSPDTIAQGIMTAADKAAAENPNPSAPGAWAKNLLAGAHAALSGKDNFTAGGTARDVLAGLTAPVRPGIGGAGVGMAGALASRDERKKEISEEQRKRMHAMADEQIDMMRVDHARRAMATDDPDLKIMDDTIARDKSLTDTITRGGEDGRGGAQVLMKGKTDSEIAQAIQDKHIDPMDGHRYADGKIATGKKDIYGNPLYEYTYTWVSNPKAVTIGDPDHAEKDAKLLKRFKDADITLDDGKPIVPGTVMPGEAYGRLTQLLQNRETAVDAINQRRAKELTDEDVIKNRDLLDAYGKQFSIASKKFDVDDKYRLEDARVQAYYSMLANPEFKDDAVRLQNLAFGSKEDADKELREFQEHHDADITDAEMARQNLDRTDLIAALNKLSQQTVSVGADGKPLMKDGKPVSVPSPAAVSAQRRLNSISQAEIDRHEKIVLDAKAKADAAAKKQAAQMDFNGTADPDATGRAYLSGLDQQARSVIELIHSGRAPISRPDYVLARKPEVFAAVERAYPGEFDASKVDAYKEQYKQFTSTKPGTAGNAINSGGTVLQHLDELKQINEKYLAARTPGTDAYRAFENKLDTVAGELLTFYGLPKTNEQMRSQKESLGGKFGSRDVAINTQIDSMIDKLASYANQWSEAAPSKNYEAKMPSINEQSRELLAQYVQKYRPDFLNDYPVFAPKGTTSAGGMTGVPPAAVGTMIGKDGREHYVDANHNWLGVVPGSGKANTGGASGSF